MPQNIKNYNKLYQSQKKDQNMEKIKATFVKDGKWWVAYTDDIPGAMTQGKTIEEAEKNLIEVIKELESFRDNSEIIYEKIIDLKKATA